MCSFSSEHTPFYVPPLFLTLPRSWPSKRHHRHLRSAMLNRRRAQKIEMKNLKLYMENKTIIEENEKLRKQATLLHKENQALFSQLQKKLSEQDKK